MRAERVVVHSEVGVDEAIPHPGHRAPLHLRIARSELLWQLLCRLADHLQAPHERPAQRLVGLERLWAQPAAATHEVIGLGQDMAQVLTRLEGHPPLQPGYGGR